MLFEESLDSLDRLLMGSGDGEEASSSKVWFGATGLEGAEAKGTLF